MALRVRYNLKCIFFFSCDCVGKKTMICTTSGFVLCCYTLSRVTGMKLRFHLKYGNVKVPGGRGGGGDSELPEIHIVSVAPISFQV